ncbi:SDR family NAD(P)-dependent oxidoreductase [Sorangium sp. So ce204]|uniref:SDR family NAD(P)-dependent oxidoreductase n=1 Tax=Sorangium sp. So ce204 TaxID=3133288 RepID=UPI003F5EE9AC
MKTTEERLTRREVLRRIEAGLIDAEEGLRLLKQTVAAGSEPAAASSTQLLNYYRGVWAPAAAGDGRGVAGRSIVVLDDGEEILRQLQAHAGERARVSLVRPGERYREAGRDAYEIDPERFEDYERLLRSLRASDRAPDAIVNLWSRAAPAPDAPLGRGALALFLLAKALLAAGGGARVDLLYLYPAGDGARRPEHAGVAGFARSLRREDPRLRCAAVGASGASDAACVQAVLSELDASDGASDVLFRGGARLVRRFEPLAAAGSGPATLPLRPDGAYLVTGGAGGLGARFAELLATHGATRLVLSGRSAPDAARVALVRRLSALGADAVYLQADLTQRSDVERLVAEARRRHGGIRGILHCAGVVRDSLLVNKTLDAVRAVLDPKVRGSLFLDELTAGEPLDFFVLFSSIAGALGSVGQCDYAYANSFLDGFAAWREALRARGERAGSTLSIGWPLFADGGMGVDPAFGAWLRGAGLELLGAPRGFQALGAAHASGEPHVVVLHGEPEAARRLMAWASAAESTAPSPASAAAPAAAEAAVDDDLPALRSMAEAHLRELLSRHIKLPASAIRSRDPFERFGIDSLMIVTLIRELERHFGELPKTLFFEHQTLEELAGYFAEHHAAAIQRQAGAGAALPRRAAPISPGPAPRAAAQAEKAAAPITAQPIQPSGHAAATTVPGLEEIAIVGVAGRYPMADDLDEFWSNLRQGRDCISEIPPDRWSLDGFYDPERGKLGRSYSKWGGFLRDVDKFDPLFFNISPKEAELIDPQERLFLETTWHAVEDAGYTRERLARSKVGVFVGVMYGHYQLFGADVAAAQRGLIYGSSFASIANRVSYFFNLSGPSLAIDTMCSSSLAAIHLAWRSIQLGECDVAIAGGVNVTVHPYKYWLLSQGRFAASDGRCHSFGEGGDGYVPGEGVGAVLLKPLSRAVRDRDHIYAIIRGSALNHGGKTNGYTVPNPKAQAELVAQALRCAQVGPADISYVEAHGTGTALGDPIEISALARAFQRQGEGARALQRCPIGSVKSNIGHLESAAGIAAVTKVLLQLKHGELAPSLHAERLNPNIPFEQTPFYVQRELAPWPRLATSDDGAGSGRPRHVGVSSFGAGGANAHLVLAEHIDEPVRLDAGWRGPYLVVLSARCEERLNAYAARLLRFVRPIRAPRAPAADSAGEPMQQALLRLAADAIGVDPAALDPNDRLHDCCDDGIALAELADRIGALYGVSIEPDLFEEHPSLAAVAAFLSEGAARSAPAASGDATVPANVDLAELAYTLQVGREAMRERLALVVSDLGDLVAKLDEYIQGRRDIPGVSRGSARPGEAIPERLMDGPAGKEFLRRLAGDRELDKLAQLWAWGVEIPWDDLYEGAGMPAPRRVSAPTYPFARERCWVQDSCLPSLGHRASPHEDGAFMLPNPNGAGAPLNGAFTLLNPNGAGAPLNGTDARLDGAGPRGEGARRPLHDAVVPLNGVGAQHNGVGAAHTGANTPARQDARAAAASEPDAAGAQGRDAPISRRLERDLQRIAADLIRLSPERLEIDAGLGDYGFESTTFVALADRVSSVYDVEVSPTVFFERSSVRGLGQHLLDASGSAIRAYYERPTPSSAAAPSAAAPAPEGAPRVTSVGDAPATRGAEPIAIIGMAGVFAGSRDLGEFWRNLQEGRDLVTEVPADRWTREQYDAIAPERITPRARWGSFIDDIDKFDARFFNISPIEADMMDPQQRIFLEIVWKAIEDAGYRASAFSGRRVGVFAGVQFNDYKQLLGQQGEINAQMGLGNEHSILVNRISYQLNLRGPSEPYNTACSSALVAVHRAMCSLQSGESELAIAGGISLMINPYTTMAAEALGILSPDGRCKTLDASANGYVRGEGGGAVVLKPLRRAIEDRDHIYAVLRGAATNHGGKAASLTAPNSEAQAALLCDAYRGAGVDPETIAYLELHGTGTKLGDPVEIDGIKLAFRQLAATRQRPIQRVGYCGLGSVKTNIGHLEPAAGIAGLIKVVLSMQHKVLPGMLHLKELNPYVKLDGTPFHLVDRTRPWEPLRDEEGRQIPRRAGVSSFGFGGVNAHVVLEEYVAPPGPAHRPDAPELIVLSAKTPGRLDAYAEALASHIDRALSAGDAPSLPDLAYTLQIGREELPERLAFTARSLQEVQDKLARHRDGAGAVPELHRGSAAASKAGDPGEEERDREAASLLEKRDLGALAQRWVAGAKVRWTDLRRGAAVRRVPAPTYPFERKRHWALRQSVIAAKPSSRPVAAAPATPPVALRDADPVLTELRALFAEELRADMEGLDPDTNFVDYGIDSILASVIIQRVQQRFGDLIPMTGIFDHPTLREFAAFVKQEIGYEEPAAAAPAPARPRALAPVRAKLPPEIVPLNTKGSRRPSFWVHGGPGYAAIYNSLQRALGPDYPFYAFQARGVDNKLIPHSFDEIVEHYIRCMRLVQPEGPYNIAGYSYGGLVALEIAHRLHATGHGVAHLTLFDTIPPVDAAVDIFFKTFGHDDNFLTIMMANEFAGAKKDGKAFVTSKDLEDVPVKLHVAHVAKLAKARGKNAMSADDIYNYIRGCIKLGDYTEVTYNSYRPPPYGGSDVLYLKANIFLEESSWTGVGHYDVYGNYDYVGDWRKLVTGQLEVVEIPCDHFNLIEEPALPLSAGAIRRFLEE